MTRLNVDCTGCTVSIPVAASLLYSKTFLDPLYFFFPCCPFFCLRIVPTCILSSTLPYPPSYFPTSRCSVLQNSQLPFPVEWLFILYFFCFLFWEVLFFFLFRQRPDTRHKWPSMLLSTHPPLHTIFEPWNSFMSWASPSQPMEMHGAYVITQEKGRRRRDLWKIDRERTWRIHRERLLQMGCWTSLWYDSCVIYIPDLPTHVCVSVRSWHFFFFSWGGLSGKRKEKSTDLNNIVIGMDNE